MPIKFRCSSCRQFLGISRAQAGGVVDCPTCGRTIRVPLLDGTVQPIPDPGLNRQDEHLVRALDELAQLGELRDRPLVPAPASALDDDDELSPEHQIPQPIPEPIPIEVPIAPIPVRIDPPFNSDGRAAAESPVEPTSNPSSTTNSARDAALFAELAALAVPVATSIAPGVDNTPSPRESHPIAELEQGLPQSQTIRPRGTAGRTTFTVLALFLAGMLTERITRFLEGLNAKASGSTSQSSEDKKSPVEPVVGVTGRVTYKSNEGDNRPDRGARLIVLPSTRVGEIKLPVTGFRPADADADARVATAAIKALGGEMGIVAEDGRFRIDLPAGTYHLLVLSHFQARPEDEAPDPAILKRLGEFFDRPVDLIGRVKFHSEPLRIKGTGDVWDHVF